MTTNPQPPANWSPALKDAFWAAVNAPTYDESAAATLAFAQLLTAASGVVAVAAPPTGQTAEVRLEIARVLHELHLRDEFDATEDVDAVLAVLPPPADRSAVLREEAARIRTHCPDHLDSDSAEVAWLACHCAVAEDMLRRLADEAQQQPETRKPVKPKSHAWTFEVNYEGDKWHGCGPTYDDSVFDNAHETAQEDFQHRAENDKQRRRFRMIRATTTYAVEAERQPAAVSAVPPQPEETNDRA